MSQRDEDSFDVTALYYDLLRTGADDAEVARHVVRPGDVVIDIGAGSGRVAVHVARTASQVHALEPNRTMRSLLLSHLSRHPEVLGRITVLPLAAESDWQPSRAVLPPQSGVDVVLMLGVMHMLEPSSRKAAFRNVARWLGPEGLVVITGVTDTPVPVDISLGRVSLGAIRVEGRLRTHERAGTWRTLIDYVTASADEVLTSERVEYVSYAPGVETIDRELGAVGLGVVWAGTLDDHDTAIASRGRSWQPAEVTPGS